MLSCKDVSKIVSDERPLGLWKKIQLKFHLAICTYCRFYVAGMNKINEALKSNLKKKTQVDAQKISELEKEIISNLKKIKKD